MLDFARRWMDHAKQTTGVLGKVDAMWTEAFQDPDFRDRSPIPFELMAYVKLAVHNAYAAGVMTFP